MINGLTARNLLASAWASNFVPDMGTAAEVTLDYSSGSAEAVGGGLGINLIPEGRRQWFHGSLFAAGANGSFQANNYTDELKNAGLTAPNKLHRVYDINPSGGGPDRSGTSCGSTARCAGRRTRSTTPARLPTRMAAT